mmetsp:Transcript_36899/g.64658  ORF Transcript_36899/g.64658 Transcript_36899/m.64658 type:complete len:205 (-) Transcript_36899:117-731(-)
MYGVFFPFSSSVETGGTIFSYHSSSSLASVPVSSVAMASAFRFADRRSLAFSLSSFSRLVMDSLRFLATWSFALSDSDSTSTTADARLLLLFLPFFFFPSLAALLVVDDALCSSYHSIKTVTSSHPDSSAAMASAFFLADRRSLEFRLSGLDSRVASASSSFSAAADLVWMISSLSPLCSTLAFSSWVFVSFGDGSLGDGSGGV